MFALGRLIAALGRPAARTPYARAAALVADGRFAQALVALDALPLDAGVLNKRGVALIGLGRRDDALAAFGDALLRDERHAPALTNLGNLLLEDGALHDAVDYYRDALAADPDYAPAHRNLAVALRRLRRRGEAVRELRWAVRLAGRRRRPPA